MTNTIHCPKCHAEIEVSDVLTHAIEQRLAHERVSLQQDAQHQARAAIDVEMHDLNAQLQQARDHLASAREQESALRKERRAMEDRQREMELALQRTLDEERLKIREEAKRLMDDEHRMKEADRDKLIGDLRQQIGELRRKAEQGIPSIQGEVMEVELEELLRGLFPHDEIVAVPVGVHGGDLLQHVRDTNGQRCGVILWESKRTKNWNDGWLAKLRDDQREARAEIAVIASAELPRGMATLGHIDGVWITRWSCVPGLAAALRAGLIEIARTRKSFEGRQTKADQVVDYLCGPAFRQKVQGIVEAYESIKDDLLSEKRAHQRMWNRRERQLERALLTTSGLVGDLSGILGASMPPMDQLTTALITFEDDAPLLQETSPF